LPQEGLLRVTKHFLTNPEERSCSQSELKPFSQVISLIERAWLAPSDSLAGLDRLGLPKHGKNKKTTYFTQSVTSSCAKVLAVDAVR
jgi:hypothetical protein